MKTWFYQLTTSLKYKLLSLLIIMPLIVLSAYGLLAVNLFEKDKIAYAYDSILSFSNTLAVQTQTQLANLNSTLKLILQNYSLNTLQFGTTARTVFEMNDDWMYLEIYNPMTQSVESMLSKPTSELSEFLQSQNLSQTRKLAQESGLELLVPPPITPEYEAGIYSKRIDSGGGRIKIVSVVFRVKNLISGFQEKSSANHMLVSRKGRVLVGVTDSEFGEMFETNLDGLDLFSKIKSTTVRQGVFGTHTPHGQEYLGSYSAVEGNNFYVVSLSQRSKALQAVDALIKKSILFFMALIAFSVLVSVFASNQLTHALRKLQEATVEISKGRFDIKIEVTSRDEVGILAEGFNLMTSEISRLMLDNVHKARMEKELETAKTVQETLFPKPNATIGPFEISGFYQPASECGGDWWHYSETETHMFIWIGDATGHGAPAALVTSATRAVSSILENDQELTPKKALEYLNRAIYFTSKGGIQMTFFIAGINKKTGLMTYANASHEPPYLVHKAGVTEIKKTNLNPLNDVNGARLGEHPDSVYHEHQIQLASEDLIFFYTDGVSDVPGVGEKTWGKRQFVNAIVSAANGNRNPEARTKSIQVKIDEHRQTLPLNDDITIITCEYKNAS